MSQPADQTAVEFISASTAGVVDVELGFEPDFALFIQNHGGTNPNIYIWANNDRFAGWAVALALLITGSSGVVTRNTTAITAYDGNETIATAETADSSPKHVNIYGNPAAAGHITAPGLAIPAALQTNSGRNFLMAFRIAR